jgi:para-aminobenzoate synthetase component 1
LAQIGDWPHAALLHSAAPGHSLSRYSWLTADPVAWLAAPARHWPDLAGEIRAVWDAGRRPAEPQLPPFQGGWLGWLGYELGQHFEQVAAHPLHPAQSNDVELGLYDWVLAWDHERQRAWLISTGIDANGVADATRAERRADDVMARLPTSRVDARKLTMAGAAAQAAQSNFSPAQYHEAVARTIDHVLAGDIFQANIAQRFATTASTDAASILHRLVARTQAPMTAYLRHADRAVISASPERFLRYDAVTRRIETRPIKGTRPRGVTEATDRAMLHSLRHSAKDRAENVMIVDLLRNDLSRVSRPGTVSVTSLCAVESHPTVHHLVSTIEAELAPQYDALDLIAASFPGGSITGAPKRRAMEIITETETVPRGVYSGAILWLGLDGAMDSSLAIRTIVLHGDQASVHAGGGITARSTPSDEYAESLAKAAALLDALDAAP